MTEKIHDFKDMRIWQKGIGVVKDIYKVTKRFPREKLYGLTSQMRRSAVSIPSNIAEGFRRYHNKEYKQFLYIAMGSCAELETQIIISHELDYLHNNDKMEMIEKLTYICQMINKLIKKL